MESVIYTPRLKLISITKADQGSVELEWLHTLRSNEETTYWSIFGRSTSVEQTQKLIKNYLPAPDEEEDKSYRVVYAIHKILEPATDSPTNSSTQPAGQAQDATELIGLVNLASVGVNNLPLPEELTLPASAADTTLTVEVAYMFLPTVWGAGYATEAVNAVYEAAKRTPTFWAPYPKLYVRSIVNSENPKSQRVMHKTGMVEKGVYRWSGKAIHVGGRWREQDDLHIYGRYLIE